MFKEFERPKTRQPNARLTIRLNGGVKLHLHDLFRAPVCELEKLQDWLGRLIEWRKQNEA